MKSYKKWSPQERMKGYRIVKAAIEEGKLKRPSICRYCSNSHDIHYHQENYDDPLNPNNLHEVCFRCHILIFHNYRKPQLTIEYKERLNNGERFPEVKNRQVFLGQLNGGRYWL